MKLKRITAGLLAVGMAASLAACGGSGTNTAASSQAAASSTEAASTATEATDTEGASYLIRIASSSPTVEFEGEGTTSLGKAVNYFIREIEARTGGRVTAQVFPDGQIASSTQEYIGGLQAGSFDIGILNCGSWADYTPAFAGLNFPYLYFSFEQAWDVLDSEVGQAWKDRAFADTQCTVLAYIDIGFRQLTANKEVHAPADMAGIKIRTMTDPIQVACWEALGAAVTPVPYSELYTALQQKMVDAQENPPSNIYSAKLYELQKYCVLTNHNFTVTIPAAGPVFWNGLTDSDKALIQEVWTDAMNYSREYTPSIAEDFLGRINDGGCTVVELTEDELSEFQATAKSVWPMIKEQMGAEAYDQLLNYMGVEG